MFLRFGCVRAQRRIHYDSFSEAVAAMSHVALVQDNLQFLGIDTRILRPYKAYLPNSVKYLFP